MIIYAVKTYGGQIIEDQTPIEVEVGEQLKPYVKQQFKQNRGFMFTRDANYYDTFERAKAAIRWALSN